MLLLRVLVLTQVTFACVAAQIGFDDGPDGQLPAGFMPLLSGQGQPGAWVLRKEASAPSAPMVLAQTNADPVSYRFPLCILETNRVLNPELSVRFRAVSGKKDQGAGLVWRYQDTNNYYVVRANALEDNVVLYKMQDGKRTDLKPKGADPSAYGRKVKVAPREWHTLAVKVNGAVFEVALNGEPVFSVEDRTFEKPGLIGLWTKADSLVEFDDLICSGD